MLNRLASQLKMVVVFLLITVSSVIAANTSAETKIYYIHNDHLGTPQVVTDEAQQVVWQADYKPFGEVDVVVDEIGLDARFPGQYADDESGLYYNYYRDYDPSLGRYLQSDPIGLGGGINTYGYVNQNPLIFADPYGLTPEGAAAGAAIGCAIGGYSGSAVGGTVGAGGGLFCGPGAVACSPVAAAAGATAGGTLGCAGVGAVGALVGDFLSDMLSESSNVDESECEKDCGLKADAQILICDATVGVDFGKKSKAYRTCTDRVNANYVECIQDCVADGECD